MFNRELREEYIKSIVDSGKSPDRARSVFGVLEKFELGLGKDITEANKDELERIWIHRLLLQKAGVAYYFNIKYNNNQER